ncbi:uracil-DNA glycosylase [Massilia sp. CF038]|uniref:uracil-DNA glycosylase n=1 Tax=Massilia sp. CF038 TaxID=1881045 RepID=UPI000915981D|nr:uracil-DNA glycosylase [Massilia sp. CF038]SHH03542.1 DNA polymerase [Massilia sp. CF038]
MSAIDPRSAAFLQEMGITPLWRVRGAVAEAPPALDQAVAEAVAQIEPAPLARAEPVIPRAAAEPDETTLARRRALETPPVSSQFGPREAAESAWGDIPPAPPVTDEDIARMDWAELKTAISNCTRCDLCKSGKKAVQGSGAQQALWLVAAGASTAADEKERRPLTSDAGKLLDNMLAAVELTRSENVYVTNLIKCRPSTATGGDRAPTMDEAMACRPFLARELALSGAGMVLTLGQIAANALQDKPLQEPLAGARGSVHAFNGVPLVATLHPGELLRRGADKALAWADLCLARAHDGRPG